jgi:hypothetical protein
MQIRKIFNAWHIPIFLAAILFTLLIYIIIKRDNKLISENPYIIMQDHRSYRASKIDSVTETGVYFQDYTGKSILIKGKVVIEKEIE